MRTKFELADVVRLFAPALADSTKLTPLQLKVLGKIAVCRTAVYINQKVPHISIEKYTTYQQERIASVHKK